MASERQLLLGIIAVLLVLFVVREASTLKAAEGRPIQGDAPPLALALGSDFLREGHLEAGVNPFPGPGRASAPIPAWGGVSDESPIVAPVKGSLADALRVSPPRAPASPPQALTRAEEVTRPSAVAAPQTRVAAPPVAVAHVAPLQAKPQAKPQVKPQAKPQAKPTAVFKEVKEKEVKGWTDMTLPKFGGAGLAKKRGGGNKEDDKYSSSSSSSSSTSSSSSAVASELLPFGGVYMCHDVSETYGAAWIVSRAKFMATGFGPPWTYSFDTADMRTPGWSIANNITFNSVNMEGASHIVLKQTKGAFKTVDAFDFLVEHLSIYERRLGLLHLSDKYRPQVMAKVIRVMQRRERALRVGWELGADADQASKARGSADARVARASEGGGLSEAEAGEAEGAVRRAFEAMRAGTAWGRGAGMPGRAVAPPLVPASPDDHNGPHGWTPGPLLAPHETEALGDRVVACMPFYGSGVGTGHSMAQTRFVYLNATFFSIAKVFKHVVVFVENANDLDYCRHRSGLPFYEVVWIKGLENPKLLGVATVIEMQRKFQSQEWLFDWIYFTESDQVLHLRPHQLGDLLKYASNTRDVIAPHRFLPFPHPRDFDEGYFATLKAMSGGLKKELDTIEAKRMVHVKDETKARCCFDRGDCRRRDQWVDWNEKAKGSKQTEHGGGMVSTGLGAMSPTLLLRSSGSHALINGEGNLFKMSFRTCALQEGGMCA